MSETALIFLIISFGLLILIDIVFIIFCITISGRISKEEEYARIKEIHQQRDTEEIS